jgi:uncharacterized repeat protein (TIGR03803 family)
LYAFVDDKGGKNPEGPLVNIGGLLYGTAYSGGHGFGTIFKLDPATGTETLATKFQGGALGANPASSLFVDGAGAIYGTTVYGGTANAGTVFKLNRNTGNVNVVYSFTGGASGGNPSSSLVKLRGALYGTTYTGGTANLGTVFSLVP